MKAPDKIYTDNRGVYAELPIFSQADSNIEYIRKNALLEWAKKEMGEWSSESNTAQGVKMGLALVAVAIFAAMQDHYNPSRDPDLALHYHHKGESYRRAVLDNLEVIRRYEAARKSVTK